MTNNKEQKRRVRVAKPISIESIGIHIDLDIYEKIKAKAATKYTTASTIARQAIGKIIKADASEWESKVGVRTPMKLYPGNGVILSTRIPSTWKKALAAKARKEKTTINTIIKDVLEKKFKYLP
jgi:predicted HicB family RNase H-like nuclease